MRYKRLASEEFSRLATQFQAYLNMKNHNQSIEQIEQQDQQLADKLRDSFSDLVYDKLMRGTEFIEHRTQQELKVYHCAEAQLEVVVVQLKDGVPIDLRQKSQEDLILSELKKGNAGIKLLSGTIAYKYPREQQIFKLLEGGLQVSDERLYKALKFLMGSMS